jgi:hypothetical protein
MITYATVFLLKVQQKWDGAQIGIDLMQIQDLVSRVINLLQEAKAGERHLAHHIAVGLSKMLERVTTVGHRNTSTVPNNNQGEASASVSAYEYQVPGNGSAVFDPGSLEMYGDISGYGQDFPFGFFDVFSSTIPEWK